MTNAAARQRPPADAEFASERDRQWATTHRKILDAARDTLEEKGYRSTSMSEVARRAGVTRTALYLHFENKLELITQLVRELPPVFIDADSVLARPVDRASMRRWVYGFVDWFEKQRPLLIAMHEANAFEPGFDDYIVFVIDRIAEQAGAVLFPTATVPRQVKLRLRLMLAQVDWFCTRAILRQAWDGSVEEGVEALLDLWLDPIS